MAVTAPPTRWQWRAVYCASALVLALALALLSLTQAFAAGPAYTALGDSYSSGVGTRVYFDTACQRSIYAYPEIDAARLGASLTFAACGGAKTGDVLANQLSSLNATTRYVTISVGGNDIGFSSVIKACALPWPYNCTGDINAANDKTRNELPAKLDAVYAKITALAPHARVAVVGYPRLFNGQECNLLARISPQEQAQLNASADLLATTTQARAAAHGFRFVDSRPAFTGHAVCDAVEWINGLSDPTSESYHPNRDGHVAYANLVEPVLKG